MSTPSGKHVIAISVRPQFAAAIKQAAELEMLSVSDLIRQTMVAKVRELGIEPVGRERSP
jgi:hypothetical protein